MHLNYWNRFNVFRSIVQFVILPAIAIILLLNACTSAPAAYISYVRVADTIDLPYSADTTLMIDTVIRWNDSGWSKEIRRTKQYKVWLKRKQDIVGWSKTFSFIKLPANARIIDTRQLQGKNGSRSIVAWMTNAELNFDYSDGEEDRDENQMWWYSYRGSGYFKGNLYFTLVDDSRKQVINTVKVIDFFRSIFYNSDKLGYDEVLMTYPFFGEGIKYQVKGDPESHTGEADIMHLFDFNGDGKKHEFMLTERDCSECIRSLLLGYNETKDSLFQYAWKHTVYMDIGNQNPEIFLNKYEPYLGIPGNSAVDIFTDPFFDYVKYYGSGKLSRCVHNEYWENLLPESALDRGGHIDAIGDDGDHMNDPMHFSHTMMGYDTANDQYYITEIYLPLFNQFRFERYTPCD